MSKLIVMVGAPGSGKSTYVREVLKNPMTKVVSRDEIRFSLVAPDEPYFSKEKEVFDTYINEIIKGFKEGYDVIADATHLTPTSRNKVLNKLPRCHAIAIFIDTPLSVALEQNELRRGTRAYVPPNKVTEMYDNLVKPETYERFERIYTVQNGKIIRIEEGGGRY